MSRVISALQKEPVRVYVYSVAVTVAALLVGLGVVQSNEATLGMAVVTSILAVPAAEVSRKKVTPVAKAQAASVEVFDNPTEEPDDADVAGVI